MAVHDVSHELRGEHGKWSKSGIIGKLASEAKAAAGASHAESGHKAGDRVKYKTGSMGTVHHIDDKGKVHVVWDKGRGKPVATPAAHLTHAEGGAKQAEKAAATEKAARDLAGQKPTAETHMRDVVAKSAGSAHPLMGKQVKYTNQKTGDREIGKVVGVQPKDESVGRGFDNLIIEGPGGKRVEKAASTVREVQASGNATSAGGAAPPKMGKSPTALKVGEKAAYPGGHTVVRTGSGGGPTGWQATIGGKTKFYAPNQAALLSVALRRGSH